MLETLKNSLCLLTICLIAGMANGQQLANYDFSTEFPDYSYGYSYAGQGNSVDVCDMNIVNDDETSFMHDGGMANPSASTTADFSQWMIAGDACYTYAGWGVGVGTVMGFDDGTGTGTLQYNRQFTSNDLSQYSVSFDARVEGVDPFDPLGLVATLSVQLQGPSISAVTGNPKNMANLGNDEVIDPIRLTDTFQTFSFTFDELVFATGADSNGEIYDYQTLADYQAGAWDLIAQMQVQLQAQGDVDDVGLDANNFLEFDNIVINAPFMDITQPGGGDFNGDGVYDCADIDMLISDVATMGNTAMFDLNGDMVVDLGDRDAWLAEAGAVNNTSGNPYLAGDYNLDGVVDVSDFNIWNGNNFTDTGAWCLADGNGDGVTDVGDFNIWNGNNFNASDHSPAAVPEPGTLSLLGIAMLGMLGIRRRR